MVIVDYEPGLYEEFNYKEEPTLLKETSKYLDIFGDTNNSAISDNKEVIVKEDDNEYEPIDRMVGQYSTNISWWKNSHNVTNN